MAFTRPGQIGVGVTAYAGFTAKALSAAAQQSILVEEFDTWRESYQGATVSVFIANTTTLAPLYSDAQLTTPIANPQILATRTDAGGRSYGKFVTNVYTNTAYYTDVAGRQQTGIQNPGIRTLQNENASEAYVRSARGGVNVYFEDWLGRTVHANDFGTFTADSPAGNSAIITAAIGSIAADGGGIVILPPGSVKFTTLNLPQNVVMRGAGRDVTVLQSQEASRVITLSGDGAGLEDVTLDGIGVVPASIGVYGKNIDRDVARRVTIKRFATGVLRKGAAGAMWEDLIVTNCTDGVILAGDVDASNGANGDSIERMSWTGGELSLCTGYGLALQYVDRAHTRTMIRNVLFYSNIGTAAVFIEGATDVNLDECSFTSNSANLQIKDKSATAQSSNILIAHGSMLGGTCRFDGLCADVAFERMALTAPTFELSTPAGPILLRDCREISPVITTGDTQKLQRWQTSDNGVVQGRTTDANAVVVWRRTLEPGEVVMLEMTAAALQLEDAQFAGYFSLHGAQCPAATLAYDGQVTNFTLGRAITGALSGATAVLQGQTDGGATGTLNLIRLRGTFLDNENLSDGLGGDGQVNGSITYNAAVAFSTAMVTSYSHETVAGWVGPTLAVNGRELRITVTGAAGDTVDWSVTVRATDRL